MSVPVATQSTVAPQQTAPSRSLRLLSALLLILLIAAGSLLALTDWLDEANDRYIAAGLILVIPALALLRILLFRAPWFSLYVFTALSWLVSIAALPRAEWSTGLYVYYWPCVGLLLLAGLTLHAIGVRKRYLLLHREPMYVLPDLKESLAPLMGEGVLREVIFSELRMYYYCLFVWFRRPVLRDEVEVFTYHRKSMIKVLLIFGLVMVIIDVTLIHWLIALFSQVWAWIVTALGIYTAIFVVAFYNSVRYGPHAIDGEHIHFRQGMTWEAKIHVSQLASIERCKSSGLTTSKPDKHAFKCIIGLDDPQLEVRLTEEVLIRGMYGMTQRINKIQLWVDEPNQLYDRLQQWIEQSQPIDGEDSAGDSGSKKQL